mmetsp:Transcript_2888/g.6811  ORF Transcript_2888/g.6811 Transcript_2888/m.6811 type:complete len:256 (+) Transcript_2888:193-960(+)
MNMNSRLHKPLSVLVLRPPRKGLQVVQNGTVVSAVLVVEFYGGTRAEELARIQVLKMNLGLTSPVLWAWSADDLPVVSVVSMAVSVSKTADLLLSAQWRFHLVRVQIDHGFQVCQADDFPALDGHGGSVLAGRAVVVFFSEFGVIGATDLPHQVVRSGLSSHDSHDLLSTSASQVLRFTAQQEFLAASRSGRGFDVRQFDAGSASDGILGGVGVFVDCSHQRVGPEKTHHNSKCNWIISEHSCRMDFENSMLFFF